MVGSVCSFASQPLGAAVPGCASSVARRFAGAQCKSVPLRSRVARKPAVSCSQQRGSYEGGAGSASSVNHVLERRNALLSLGALVASTGADAALAREAAAKDNFVTTPSGLRVLEFREGTGATPQVVFRFCSK